MGIRGLSTLLDNTYPIALLKDIKVHDIRLVIDGSELLYYLCYEYGELDSRCGGEYTSLREITLQFFDCLKQHNVSSYVVFDAFKSEPNPDRCLQNRNEKLVKLRRVVDGLDSNPVQRPLLGKCVLRQTLSELEIPYVIVPGDADPEMAAIANSLGAIVLAGDTDFCVLDTKEGFIPFKHLHWKQVLSDKHAPIRAKIFHRRIFSSTFQIPDNALAYLVPIMSPQDTIREVDFRGFLQYLSRTVKIPARLEREVRRPHWIEVLLIWLAENYTNDNDTIDRIAWHVPNVPRAKLEEIVGRYRDLPSVERYIETLKGAPTCQYENSGARVKTTHGARFLSLVQDNQDMESAHNISLPIRKAVYQIEIYKAQLEDKNVQSRIIEMDRRGKNGYGMILVPVTVDQERLQHLRLDTCDTDAEAMEGRRRHVFETLLSDPSQDLDQFEALGAGLDVLAATFKYWRLNLAAPPPAAVCRALAFTFAACSYEIRCEDLPDRFQHISNTEFDKNALHFSAQWQCCAKDTIKLNQFLGHPVAYPKVGKLFSGRFFQKAHAFFKSNEHMGDQRIGAELLLGHQDAMALYKKLIALVRV